MGERDGTPEQDAPELCDFCGTVVSEETELYAFVPDSSAIHGQDAKFDGKRLVSACTDDHLHRLVEQYRRRPFIDAELWAGKVFRAVDSHRGRRIDDDTLVGLTGLTVHQIHAGIAWHNERARAVHEHGDDTDA
ncbi:hypothetical protein HFP15_40865 [Amycolatopsis sp. K13G38]|uniref:HNH endonuclease n=1 Tax=Amycolatopsis acididurans TaxID=2724524 RepID=A0ABX1JJY2_9PSEU|nr:hypothetical protein [Amycolatopsis acididurans]NKQ59210.1 hypothetical protein [Amycolatopsis acididurans]